MTGSPSRHDYKRMMCKNMLTKVPVNIMDVGILHDTFGTGVGSLKGNTTCTTLLSVATNMVILSKKMTDTI